MVARSDEFLAATTQRVRLMEEDERARSVLALYLTEFECAAQKFACLLLGVAIIALLVLAESLLRVDNNEHADMTRIVGLSLAVFFLTFAFLMSRGWYRPYFKYVNVAVQVTMVTAVIAVDAEMRGARYALSSMPPFFYGLVVGLSSFTLSPATSLLTGVFSAVQFMLLYAYRLRDLAAAEGSLDDLVVSWEITSMKAIVFLATGFAATFMTRRARRLILRIAVQSTTVDKLSAVQKELDVARDIQRTLIPRETPMAEGLELNGCYLPAKNVGGDLWDAIPFQGGVLLVISDVSGKGIPAALTMAGFQSTVRALARRAERLEQLVEETDDLVSAIVSSGRFVTAAFVLLDVEKQTARVINCGHPPVLVLSTSGGVEMIEAQYPPLGVVPGAVYEGQERTIRSGDVFFLCTDGLVDLRNRRGVEYGAARIAKALTARGSRDLGDMVTRLSRDIASYLGKGVPHDDLTFLAARIR